MWNSVNVYGKRASVFLYFRLISRTIRKGLAIFGGNKPPRRRRSTIKKSRNKI